MNALIMATVLVWETWSFHLDPWRLALSGLLLAVFAGELFLYTRTRGLGSKAWQSYALRGVGILVVALLILEPARLEPIESQSKPRLAVLVDQSASLSVRDFDKQAPGEPRYQRLQTLWDAQQESQQLRLFSFGQELKPISAGSIYPVEPWDSRSNLDQALRSLSRESTALSGVLVLSDGLVATRSEAFEALSDAITQLDVPVSLANISKAHRRDLALSDPQIPEFCFAQNATELSVTLTREKVKQNQVRVELWRDGTKLTDQRVDFVPGQQSAEVVFRHTPPDTGNFVYSIRVPALDNEASTANNEVFRSVSVLRDKVRVLHVAGRPDWDVRALRTLLKRNPNVELLSYYILRDEEDQMRDDPNAPMSLIQFPHRELFEEELGSFDLIILQNFDATARSNYNRNLGQFILDGGSIAVIGGDLGLSTGDYSIPPFSGLLPALPRVEDMRTESVGTQLTKEGQHHPITAWMQALAGAESLRLPALDSLNRSEPSLKTQDRAQVLLKTTPLADDQRSYPLLAVAHPGKGRLLELLTASSWRWGFAPQLSLLDGLRPYDRLWQEIIRWSLREDPSPLSVQSSNRLLDPGQAWTVELGTHNPDGSPQAKVPIDISVLQGRKEITKAHVRSDELGQGSWTWTPKERGRYVVELRRPATNEGQAPIQKTLALFVGVTSPDLDPLDPNPYEPRLRRIVEASGGRYWRSQEIPRDLVAAIPQTPPSAPKIQLAGQSRPHPLWSAPWVWLGLLALPAEWWLRRRRGQDGKHAA